MSEEEVQDVEQDSSPVEDVNESESSTEELAEAPAEQAVPEQIVPYDRFREVNEERKYWQEKFAEVANRQPVAQPEIDPDTNLDPQTRVFYQELDKRFDKKLNTVLSQKEREYQARLDALAMQNAKVQEKLFREEQKDVIPGSREEVEIANLIRMGVDPSKAAWAVMGPKRVQSAASSKTVKQQQKVKQKAQANLETSGVPTNSGIPTSEKLSFREDLERRARQAGL